MKIFVGLISSNERVCETYENQKDNLNNALQNVPLIKRLNPIFSFGAFNPHARVKKHTLEAYLLWATQKCDGAILLIDREHDQSTILKNAYFTAILEIPGEKVNFRNFFVQKTVRLLKNFACLMELMISSDNEQAMILPLRNFLAQELAFLAAVCRDQSMDSTFIHQACPLILQLKTRKKMRRKSSYSTLYFVDDNERYFQLGKETHSQVATGSKHNALCKISGNFRFGKKILSDRHFNVVHHTENNLISGTFPNCHDEQISVSATSHINMFSNDYH